LSSTNTYVTIAIVSLILVNGISINSGIVNAQVENLTRGNPQSHKETPNHILPGSETFINIITKVDNTNGGTKKLSDFTITVTGNNPSPNSFSGSSSCTSVTLRAGNYKVTEIRGPSGYTTSYSSGCSGTASGGPIKCTISNQYNAKPTSPTPSPVPLPPPNKPSSIITITSNSRSVYSIQSTFVKVDRFSVNYTIADKSSSLNDLRNLITSTIVDDFDKNPNI
jgi:hypothetical protein